MMSAVGPDSGTLLDSTPAVLVDRFPLENIGVAVNMAGPHSASVCVDQQQFVLTSHLSEPYFHSPYFLIHVRVQRDPRDPVMSKPELPAPRAVALSLKLLRNSENKITCMCFNFKNSIYAMQPREKGFLRNVSFP